MKQFHYISMDEREELAKKIAQRITIRSYDEKGNSNDETRNTTDEEEKIIYNVVYGALGALNSAQTEKEEYQIANTAEWIINSFLPYINGYISVYSEIRKMYRTFFLY